MPHTPFFPFAAKVSVAELGISEITVKAQRRQVMRKWESILSPTW